MRAHSRHRLRAIGTGCEVLPCNDAARLAEKALLWAS